MSTNDTDANESIEPRTERALVECMTVLPEGGEIYTVVGQNGGTYTVDGREGRCTCPDAKHRGATCKHQRRVGFAIGERPVPASVDGVDEQLGEHTEAAPRVVASDGGIIEAGDEGEILDESDAEDSPTYTYHREPERVGGERYVRCEACGAECIPADPDRMLHRRDCPHRER